VMDLPRLWAPPKLRVCLKQITAGGSVLSREQFHALLEREKARADRNSHQFSLVLFKVSNGGNRINQINCLTHSLVNRIRWTDETGWFDDIHLGVVLPDTLSVGAKRLADRVCDEVTTKTSASEYTIHTYPSVLFPNGNGDSSQLCFADLFPQWEAEKMRGSSIPCDHNGRSINKSETRRLSTDKTLNDITWEQELEPFHAQRILIWKRVFDILGSIAALIVLSPLFLFVSLLIKAVSTGPVFFKQQRVGYKGKTFTMLKFRTMKVNIDVIEHKEHVIKLINGIGENGLIGERPMTKLDNGRERIPFGKILRKLCIDELPQLINVFWGEMSLVGPRPALSYEVEQYLPWHLRRFDIVPGMTGLWQVSGKNRLSFNKMVRLDIQYARQHSFWLDIKILLRTPFVVVSQIIDSMHDKRVLSEHVVEKCLTLQ
jgi:lipopolysaccharide/colanic/teichoic acid biosynthesis glycosyltransferase